MPKNNIINSDLNNTVKELVDHLRKPCLDSHKVLSYVSQMQSKNLMDRYGSDVLRAFFNSSDDSKIGILKILVEGGAVLDEPTLVGLFEDVIVLKNSFIIMQYILSYMISDKESFIKEHNSSVMRNVMLQNNIFKIYAVEVLLDEGFFLDANIYAHQSDHTLDLMCSYCQFKVVELMLDTKVGDVKRLVSVHGQSSLEILLERVVVRNFVYSTMQGDPLLAIQKLISFGDSTYFEKYGNLLLKAYEDNNIKLIYVMLGGQVKENIFFSSSVQELQNYLVAALDTSNEDKLNTFINALRQLYDQSKATCFVRSMLLRQPDLPFFSFFKFLFGSNFLDRYACLPSRSNTPVDATSTVFVATTAGSQNRSAKCFLS